MIDKHHTIGQDSFLDIIANLVGILIILIIVVGAQATAEWTKTKQSPEAALAVTQLADEVEQTETTALSLRLENHEFEEKIAKQAQLMLRLDQRRHEMLVQLAMVKKEVERKKENRNDAEKLQLAERAELESLRQQFTSVQNQMQALEAHAIEPKIEEIEHYPTPIAKTVFSDEIHFHLSQGKISYIPMDELVDLMKSEWRVKAEKLHHSNSTFETVGPIQGFHLQYLLVREDVSVPTQYGPVTKQQSRFDHFELLPLAGLSGERIGSIVKQDSQFARRLTRLAPAKTTVSIWVYPDSYEELAVVKTYLREKGFQIANWPLKFGKLVSGGPNGFRTSAQ